VPNLTPVLPLPVPAGTSLVCVLTSLPAGSPSLPAQPVSAREQSLFRHGSITHDDDSRPHCRDSNGVYQGQVPGNRRDVHPTANARDSTRHANVAERASAEHADTVEFSEVRFGENRHTFPSGGVTSTDRATREPRRSSHSPTMVYTTRHVPEPTVPRHVNSHLCPRAARLCSRAVPFPSWYRCRHLSLLLLKLTRLAESVVDLFKTNRRRVLEYVMSVISH
jgi:hypothetical protein